MKRLRITPAFLLAFTISVCTTAMSQHNKAPQSSYREIESMRLLTSSVGWASNDRHVFWTTDAGKHWKNIGPRIKPRQNIDAVFFLDTSIGWTLLIGEDEGA